MFPLSLLQTPSVCGVGGRGKVSRLTFAATLGNQLHRYSG
jgi:hypothetical protein